MSSPSPEPPDDKSEEKSQKGESKKSSQIGDFKLIKKLGQGGMGTVYLAHQVSLDRPCALKVLSKELAAKPGFVERFLREARSMAKIDHPHVVSCYAVGEDKGFHFVAMELMDGKSMQDWVDQLSKLSIPDALLVTITCADALAHAHAKSMIHRDIKPDNILVTKKGVIKVSDMGLAKVIDDEDMSMTQSGTGLGTPHYMPPEQARNAKHVDHRCDIYALGVTLYHFVTGQVPFAGGSVVDLINNKEKGFYKPAKQVNPAVPERLDLMIGKAMAKDPQHRYQNCEDFIRDLESVGLVGESLSFIDAPDKVVIRRGSSPTAATQVGMRTGKQTIATPPAAGRTQSMSGIQSIGSPSTGERWEESIWYIRYRDPQGNTKVGKMKAEQVIRLVKADQIDETATAALDSKGPFLPLAQIPVFEDESKKMLMRQGVKKREKSLASTYAKLDKQHKRQKWWRLFRKFREGTLGMVSLVIWLAIIVGIVIAGVKYGPTAWSAIAEKAGISTPVESEESDEAPADDTEEDAPRQGNEGLETGTPGAGG